MSDVLLASIVALLGSTWLEQNRPLQRPAEDVLPGLVRALAAMLHRSLLKSLETDGEVASF